MKRDFSWSERRQKAREAVDPFRKRKGGEVFNDGHNVRAKYCECQTPTTVFDSGEGRCSKCGREPKQDFRNFVA